MARIDDAVRDSQLALRLTVEQSIAVNTMGALGVALFQGLVTERILSEEQAVRVLDIAENHLTLPGRDLAPEVAEEAKRVFAGWRATLADLLARRRPVS